MGQVNAFDLSKFLKSNLVNAARVLPLGFALLPKMKPVTQNPVTKTDDFFAWKNYIFAILQIYWMPS